MTSSMQPAIALTATQAAWLTELGVDRKLLATLADTSALFAPARVVPGAGVATVNAPAGPGPSASKRTDAAVGAAPMHRAPVQSVPQKPAAVSSADTAPVQPVQRVDLPADLALLAQTVAGCQACGLHASRHQTVFGDGQANAPQWMVIGEAPGDHDDHLGLPFQGKAGELLNAMLVAAGMLAQASVFYTNLLKCRPKGGRAPRADEIQACLPYLQQQIALVKPKGLLVLGWQAAQALVGQRASLDQLRGQVYRYTDRGVDIPMVVTHHPASLLLRGQYKAAAWQDLHLARAALAAA